MHISGRALLVSVAVLSVSVIGHILPPSPFDVQGPPGPPRSYPPPSPCPQAFEYEPSRTGATGWAGVVRLLTAPRFSSLSLRVHLAASEHLPVEPVPATLSLRGGVDAARALVRAVHQGRRMVLEFVVDFSCAVTSVPYLLNVTVNGRVFCAAAQEPSDTRSTITLVSDLDTGMDWESTGEEDFLVAPAGSKPTVQYPPSANQTAPCAVSGMAPSGSPPPIPSASSDPPPHAFILPSITRPPPAWLPPSTAPEERPPPLHLRPQPPQLTTTPPSRPAPAAPAAPQQPATVTRVSQPSSHLLFDEDCGRAWSAANPLVTRGAAAVRGRWPWLVALFKKLGRRDQLGLNFECGASLVSRKHVVTAAHCVEVRGRRGRPVDAAVLVVYLGKHDLLSYTEPGQRTAEVHSVLLHPDYATTGRPSSSSTSWSYSNDIALLVLTDAVEPTEHIRPVCLWDAALRGTTDVSAIVGVIGAVPGWGKDDTGAISNEIRVANMPIVSQEACLRSNIFYHAFTSNTTFCAGFRNGTSVCNGDSGGGLFIRDPDGHGDGRWRIRGIVSVSMFNVNEQTCDSYNYAVFTDVAKYLPWLHEMMASTWTSK